MWHNHIKLTFHTHILTCQVQETYPPFSAISNTHALFNLKLFQVFVFVTIFVLISKDPETEDDDLAIEEYHEEEESQHGSMSSIAEIRPLAPGYYRPISPAMVEMKEEKKSISG